MNKLKNISLNDLYGKYCKVCDTYNIEHPPQDTTKEELLKMVITTPPLKGSGLSKLFVNDFMNHWNSTRGGSILTKKRYPLNFQKATQALIKIISFNPNNIKLSGTMSYKAFLYPSDYDLFETVNITNLDNLIKSFQSKIKHLLKLNDVYIGDIKAGEIPQLKIINERSYFKNNRVIGYSYDETINRLEQINKEGYLTKKDYSTIKRMIKKNPTKAQWNIMLKNLRIHIIRMTPKDILKGYKMMNTQKVYLKDSLKGDGLFKLDVVAYINTRFNEFSIIYDLRDNNKHRINNFKVNVNEDLKANIQQLEDNGKFFKMLKRILSLMRIKLGKKTNEKDKDLIKSEMEYITNVLNGELGIINSVINDIDIIEQILDNEAVTPTDKIKEQIDNFIYRLSFIYKIDNYIKQEPAIIKLIEQTLNITSQHNLIKHLQKLKIKLSNILNDKAKSKAYKYSNLF